MDTLPKTNIAPTNGWLEYYFPIGEAYCQGRTVSFREGIPEFSHGKIQVSPDVPVQILQKTHSQKTQLSCFRAIPPMKPTNERTDGAWIILGCPWK